MPQIPFFDNQVAVPRNPGPPQVDPGAYGRQGAALAQVGNQMADVGAQFEQRYADAARAMDAANTVAGTSKQLGDLQQHLSTTPVVDPKTGLPSRDLTYQAFQGQAAQIKAQALQGISDPQVLAHVTGQVDQQIIARGLATQNAAFQLEASGRLGDLDRQRQMYATQAANAASDPERALAVDNFLAANKAAVAGGWQSPQQGARNELSFRSQIAETQIRQQLNAALDPANRDADAVTRLARAVQDPTNYPDLQPERREILGQHLEYTAYRLQMQDTARQQRADMLAERELRQSQAANFAQDFGATLAGNGPNAAQVAEAVRQQRYSPAAADAILRAGQGRDDPMAAAHLWQSVRSGAARPDDIYAAMSASKVSGPTGVDMIKALGTRDQHSGDQVEHAAFAQLRTALGGDAVEKGLLDLGNSQHVQQVLTWAQAQGEWNRRVLVKHENPIAVRDDMIPRYQAPGHPPVTWEMPKMGPVAGTADVAGVWNRTLAAHQSGQISDADFQTQAGLINRYRKFFADQDARAAAARAARGNGGPPQAAKSRGATLMGIDSQ